MLCFLISGVSCLLYGLLYFLYNSDRLQSEICFYQSALLGSLLCCFVLFLGV